MAKRISDLNPITDPTIIVFGSLWEVSIGGVSYKITKTQLATAVGGVETIVAGTGIVIDGTDPANPIVSSTGSSSIQPLIVVNQQTASYTLVIGDFPTNGSVKDIQVTSSSATNVTIPPNSDVAAPVGSQIMMSAWGTGTVSFVAGAGVTFVDAFGVSTTAQFDSRYARQVAANIWQIL